MDKIITTVLLIIAGIICTIVVFDSVYPMVNRSSEAMSSMTENINERMKSRINIVHASNTEDLETVYIWVKNVGDTRIVQIEESDLFFGEEGDFARIPYVEDAGDDYPRWSFDVLNDTQWTIGATLEITITYDTGQGASPGTYFMKMIIPNGVSDEYFFSM